MDSQQTDRGRGLVGTWANLLEVHLSSMSAILCLFFSKPSTYIQTACLLVGNCQAGNGGGGGGGRERGCVKCVGGTRYPPHSIVCVETPDRPTDLAFRLYILGIPNH
jgi:hypothetical protein